MTNNKPAPFTVGAKEGQTVSVVGDTYRILTTGKQTGGAFAVMDFMIPPGGGPGPHAHKDIQESFYIIEGEIEVKSEAGTYMAEKGAFVTIPKGGIVHQFKNKTDKPAHMICMVVPAGLEDFFLEIGKPIAEGTFLPPPEMTPEYMAQLQQSAESHGQEVFPPDYLDK